VAGDEPIAVIPDAAQAAIWNPEIQRYQLLYGILRFDRNRLIRHGRA
jgi:hypothetical protein